MHSVVLVALLFATRNHQSWLVDHNEVLCYCDFRLLTESWVLLRCCYWQWDLFTYPLVKAVQQLHWNGFLEFSSKFFKCGLCFEVGRELYDTLLFEVNCKNKVKHFGCLQRHYALHSCLYLRRRVFGFNWVCEGVLLRHFEGYVVERFVENKFRNLKNPRLYLDWQVVIKCCWKSLNQVFQIFNCADRSRI